MARSLKLFIKGGFGPSASTGVSCIDILSMLHRSSMLRLANERNMGRGVKNGQVQEAVLVSFSSQDGVARRRYRQVPVYILHDGWIVLSSEQPDTQA